MSVAAFPREKMQMCFLSPPAATFIPADQWVTGERERVCVSVCAHLWQQAPLVIP